MCLRRRFEWFPHQIVQPTFLAPYLFTVGKEQTRTKNIILYRIEWITFTASDELPFWKFNIFNIWSGSNNITQALCIIHPEGIFPGILSLLTIVFARQIFFEENVQVSKLIILFN